MAIFDDDLFAELEPTGTARHTMPGVHVGSDHPVVLILKPAGRPNPAYMSAMRKFRDRNDPEESDLATAAIVARTVITGWEHVFKDGNPVPYSTAAGEEVLGALIRRKRSDVFLGVLRFATNMENFGPQIDPDDVGKG